jgi:thiamine kinase-like enzyme
MPAILKALAHGNEKRITASKDIINDLLQYKSIVDEYKSIIHNPQFKLRVTHHDTKISNVLFDQNNKGLCVIDLDTVMPGYFISDVGDMMRTYLSPVSEEEKDFEKIIVRKEFYKAIVEGYSNEMKDEFSEVEKNYFLFAGKFMVYMQALRFLTDYLNNDSYYGAKYEGHNLMRAKNQATLLRRLIEMEMSL